MSFQPVSRMLRPDFMSPRSKYFLVLSFFASVLTSVLDLLPCAHSSFQSLQRDEVKGRGGMKGLSELKARQLKEFPSWFSPLASYSLGIFCLLRCLAAKGELSQTLSLWFSPFTACFVTLWVFEKLHTHSSILNTNTKLLLRSGPKSNHWEIKRLLERYVSQNLIEDDSIISQHVSHIPFPIAMIMLIISGK